jgi:plastocyanin
MKKFRKHVQTFAVTVSLCAMAFSVAVDAAVINVLVLGSDGEPIPHVAVFVDGDDAPGNAASTPSATMDQVGTQFVPHMLVVETGTAVEFPNSDIVAHHVYSFSKPNNFVLPLYKGDVHAPVTFEHDGVVILGCNIHDGMLGYIVVVNSGVFGVTDAEGRVSLDIDADSSARTVSIWSPRIRDDENALSKDAASSTDGESELTFKMQKKLRPSHHSQSDAVKWSEY